MPWYQPRRISDIVFGGENIVPEGDLLPKPSVPLFKLTAALTEAQVFEETSRSFGSLLDYTHQHPAKAEVVGYNCLTAPGALKITYSIALKGDALGKLDWMPGDAFGILCQNDPEIVNHALERLSLDPSAIIHLELLSSEHLAKDSFAEFWHHRNDKQIRLKDLFTNHLDLSYFPKKACLKDLSGTCSNPQDAQDLLFLSSRSGSSAYMKIAGERTTILDWLHTFPSAKPSLELLLKHLPLLHPRFYSISNTKEDAGDQIEFVFNTIDYQTPDNLTRKGICSGWLENKIKSQERSILIVPRPNYAAFRPPLDPMTPLIMICAGTGISPFIGFLRHFSKNASPHALRWLFFGFRDINLDFLFADELNTFVETGVLEKLTLAISRQPELRKPKYVQHALSEAKEEVWRLLESNPETKIYICGDELTMIKDVNGVFSEMIQTNLGLDVKAANSHLLEWSKSGRIIKDIWI